jgi:hypothetical protein
MVKSPSCHQIEPSNVFSQGYKRHPLIPLLRAGSKEVKKYIEQNKLGMCIDDVFCSDQLNDTMKHYKCLKDEDRQGIFMVAVAHQKVECAQVMVNTGFISNTGFRFNSPLRLACNVGDEKMVNFLLEQFFTDPSDKDNEAFIIAASKGYNGIVDQLKLFTDVNPSARNNIAFIKAVENNHVDVTRNIYPLVKLTLTSQQVSIAISNAIKNGSIDTIRFIYSYVESKLSHVTISEAIIHVMKRKKEGRKQYVNDVRIVRLSYNMLKNNIYQKYRPIILRYLQSNDV